MYGPPIASKNLLLPEKFELSTSPKQKQLKPLYLCSVRVSRRTLFVFEHFQNCRRRYMYRKQTHLRRPMILAASCR